MRYLPSVSGKYTVAVSLFGVLLVGSTGKERTDDDGNVVHQGEIFGINRRNRDDEEEEKKKKKKAKKKERSSLTRAGGRLIL